VVKVLKPDTYKLANKDGKELSTLGTSSNYVASTIRKDFQDLFVNCVPNTPVGCTDVNLIELIKLKGNLAFPKKPKSPSGATTGGIPPPEKWSIFTKKIASTPSTSRPKPQANSDRARTAKRERRASRR
jgi:hypothetical protein